MVNLKANGASATGDSINNGYALVVTCPGGLENLLAKELQHLQLPVGTVAAGAVSLQGGLEVAYRICLHSRIAGRVLLELDSFPARTADDIYNHLVNYAWESVLTVDQSFLVNATLDAKVTDKSFFLALKVKDALVDRFYELMAQRPSVARSQPDIAIHLYFDGSRAAVSLDLSGEPLHRRGYREMAGEAPLKENLAAALLIAAGVGTQPYTAIVDPFCGSGTLLIEAALLVMNKAPGLLRERFGFECWQGHDAALWQRLREDAQAAIQPDQLAAVTLRGYDASSAAIQAALANLQAVGLGAAVHVERRELGLWRQPHALPEGTTGLVICNPPYGERLAEQASVPYLYQALGDKLRSLAPGWRVGILSSHIEYIDATGLPTAKSLRVNNGPLRCHFRVTDVPTSGARMPVQQRLRVREPLADNAFSNRLCKNLKKIEKWLEREQVSCFRLYDADMPEYNVAIDWYDGYFHIQEYQPPKTVAADKAEQRLQWVVDTLVKLFDIPKSRLAIKSRQRQRGSTQYQRLHQREQRYLVHENGAWLWVNLHDYLDTGLFLDHRLMRLRLQQEARNKRVLNLFAYTCTATVHAALGGARSTQSVDMSRSYLDWGRDNLLVNGFSEDRHRLVQADCLQWLRKTHEQFDLIFMDPPTFSNSKRMKGVLDVQRDHPELIELAMKRLEPGGTLYFSTNFRKFQWDETLQARFQVQEITRQTVSPDYQAGKPPHRCWKIAH